MSEFLRKYWFVTLIGILFIGVLVFFVMDLNKDNVSSRKVDGQDVVASTTLGDITSGDLYDQLEGSASSVVYNLYRNQVVDQAVEADADMKKEAKQMARNIENNMKSDPSGKTKEGIIQQLASFGFTGEDAPYNYAMTSCKIRKLDSDYVKEHFEDLKMFAPEGARTISVITMQVANDQILTEKAQAKQDAIQKAIDEGKDFSEIAKEFSEDKTAEDGGWFGYIDANATDLDENVKSVALTLEPGQMSDWISVQPDGMQMFTLYKVCVNETDPAKILNGERAEDAENLVISMTSNVNGLEAMAVDQAAKTLTITFDSEDVKKMIEDTIKSQTEAFDKAKAEKEEELKAAEEEAKKAEEENKKAEEEAKDNASSEAADGEGK